MAQTTESSVKPDQKTLQEAGELEVFDESGKAIPFAELYNTEGRTVVVFIRHFFCGVSARNPDHSRHQTLVLTTPTTALRRLRPRINKNLPTQRPRAQQTDHQPRHHRLRRTCSNRKLQATDGQLIRHFLRPVSEAVRQAWHDELALHGRPETGLHPNQHPERHDHEHEEHAHGRRRDLEGR